MGKIATLRLLEVLAVTIIALGIFVHEAVGLASVGLSVAFFLLVLTRLRKLAKGFATMDVQLIREQHRKIFPMHMLLQLALAVGAIFAL
jgi:hypothetical protein